MKKIIITEEQENKIKDMLNNGNKSIVKISTPNKGNKTYVINTDKVLLIKRFLDSNFKMGKLENIGSDGLKKDTRIFSIMSSTGESLKNLYEEDVCDLLIEKFKKMFLDKKERELFMKQVLKDWINNKIGVHGTLSVNYLK